MNSLKGSAAFAPVVAPEGPFPPKSGSFRVAAFQEFGFGLGREVYERAECVQRAREWQRSAGIDAMRADAIQYMVSMERSNRG